MEKIKFTYTFEDPDYNDERKIVMKREDEFEAGLRDRDICEMFFDFMRAVGFSEKNVLKYFQE